LGLACAFRDLSATSQAEVANQTATCMQINDVLKALVSFTNTARAARPQSILITDTPLSIDSFASRDHLVVILVPNNDILNRCWDTTRKLAFEERPLLIAGDISSLVKLLPFNFDIVVSLNRDVEAARRLDDASSVLLDGGILVRPRGESLETEQSKTRRDSRDFPPSIEIDPTLEIVRVSNRGILDLQLPLDHKIWRSAQLAFEEQHERLRNLLTPTLALQDALLEIWKHTELQFRPKSRWPWKQPIDNRLPQYPNGQGWPRISIVVPTRDQGQFIEETLLSVIRQNYPNIELIVIDGGSTDNTSEVVLRYRTWISHFVSEGDRGQSHAINKGMALADGEILTWLNSDDMLADGALYAIAVAYSTSGADIVAGICQTLKDGDIDGEHLTSCSNGSLPLARLLDLEGGWHAGQFFYQPEVFFTRSIWERAGGRVREDLTYSMDYELWLRFASCAAQLHVIGRPVALFRRHEKQKTHNPVHFRNELISVRDDFIARTGVVAAARQHGSSQRKLSFCFINDLGFEHGAGLAHGRLAQAVVAAGHLVSAIRLPATGSIMPSASELAERVAEIGPDIVVLGNVHGADPRPAMFEDVICGWPTIVVMHDFWWITGRCAYTAGCYRLKNGCDDLCPTPHEYPKLAADKIEGAWLEKRALRGHPNLILATTSEWTKSFVQASRSDVANGVYEMRLGLDPQAFEPRDRRAARSFLGLPAEDFIVLTVTTYVAEGRKRVFPLMNVLSKLGIADLRLVVLGHVSADDRSSLPSFCITPGYVGDAGIVALYYAAADVVIGASYEETFGQSLAEAAAVGTPVIAHGGSGSATAVTDGVSGVLSQTRSDAELGRLLLLLRGRPSIARRLRDLGPIHTKNQYTIEASYHSFFQLLERAGLLQRFGIRPNITFHQSKVRPTLDSFDNVQFAGSENRWLPQSGVSPREPAALDAGILEDFNWLEGPEATLILQCVKAGTYRILIEYQNILFDRQSVSITFDGQTVVTRELNRTRPGKPSVVYFSTDLSVGKHDLELSFAHWAKGLNDTRNLALVLIGVHIISA
jgi:glycosyltransferase involved in cell wall biosynthesis